VFSGIRHEFASPSVDDRHQCPNRHWWPIQGDARFNSRAKILQASRPVTDKGPLGHRPITRRFAARALLLWRGQLPNSLHCPSVFVRLVRFVPSAAIAVRWPVLSPLSCWFPWALCFP
jgi:hypothetical protein